MFKTRCWSASSIRISAHLQSILTFPQCHSAGRIWDQICCRQWCVSEVDNLWQWLLGEGFSMHCKWQVLHPSNEESWKSLILWKRQPTEYVCNQQWPFFYHLHLLRGHCHSHWNPDAKRWIGMHQSKSTDQRQCFLVTFTVTKSQNNGFHPHQYRLVQEYQHISHDNVLEMIWQRTIPIPISIQCLTGVVCFHM